MPVTTPVVRNLRKRNFEQLRPYTAERIQAKSQGVPIEVDKEVLRSENSILENYDGYIEDDSDLSFVENDIEESHKVQRRHSQGVPVEVDDLRSENSILENYDDYIEESDLSFVENDIEEVQRWYGQGVPVEVDEELWSENSIEDYDGYIEDESDLSFVENDVEESQKVQRRRNVGRSPALLNKPNDIEGDLSPESEQNLVSKKLKNLLQWADTTPVFSPNDKNFPIEKYLELFEELHKNDYIGNPWPEQARSLIRDLMMYWAGWRPNNNGINNCYKILVKLIMVVPINAYNVPDITILTQRYLDLTLQLLGRIIDDTPIDHVNEFISKFNKHSRDLIKNMRNKGVQDKANENIVIAICSVIALINKKPMSEYILNRFTYISKRNQEWIIRSLMLLNQTLKMLTSYGTGTKV